MSLLNKFLKIFGLGRGHIYQEPKFSVEQESIDQLVKIESVFESPESSINTEEPTTSVKSKPLSNIKSRSSTTKKISANKKTTGTSKPRVPKKSKEE
jgi:hypothetical protein